MGKGADAATGNSPNLSQKLLLPAGWIDGWEGTDWLPPGKPLASL